MELRVLQYFLAVAREQSILHAAESLHLSQPTLSRQLKELEEENGVQYVAARKEEDQVSLTAIGEGEVLDALRRCQPDTLTPIEAMSLLYQWKQKLS